VFCRRIVQICQTRGAAGKQSHTGRLTVLEAGHVGPELGDLEAQFGPMGVGFGLVVRFSFEFVVFALQGLDLLYQGVVFGLEGIHIAIMDREFLYFIFLT
jgi:hypothetical protein